MQCVCVFSNRFNTLHRRIWLGRGECKSLTSHTLLNIHDGVNKLSEIMPLKNVPTSGLVMYLPD